MCFFRVLTSADGESSIDRGVVIDKRVYCSLLHFEHCVYVRTYYAGVCVYWCVSYARNKSSSSP